jgi:thiol:disulfide interchange protein DsbD
MGDIQWPVPIRIQTDAIVSYGYKGEVMLLVTAQRAAAAAGAVTLAATVDYVTCRDICVKEAARASIALPPAAAMPPRSAGAALFDQARARMPKPAPAEWAASARLGADDIALRIDTQAPPRTAAFFPFVNGLIDDPASQRVESDARGVTLHLVKSPYFGKAPAALEGVLVIDGGRAFTLAAPLRAK